jgi:hypothetical protein
MAVDKRIELELVIRDTVSLTLKTVADNLEKINKSVGKVAGEGAGSEGAGETFKKIKESTEGIRKLSEEGAQEATAHAERILPLVARLSGPAGRFAFVFAATAFVMDAVTGEVKKSVALKALVEDTGFPQHFIDVLRQAQKKLGIEDGEAEENIRRVGNAMSEMAFGKGSLLAKELDRIGEGNLAKTMENFAIGGDRQAGTMAAINRVTELNKVAAAGGPDAQEAARQAIRIADALKMRPSFFKDLTETLKTVHPSQQMAIKEVKSYFAGYWDFWTVVGNIFTTVKMGAVVTANRYLGVASALIDAHTMVIDPRAREARGLPPLTAAEIEDFKKRNENTLELMKEILSIFQGAQNKESIEKRWVGGSVLPGRSYMVGEKGPEMLFSSGGSQIIGASGPEVIRAGESGNIDTSSFERFRRPLGDGGTSSFNERFGFWPQFRHTPEGYVAQPRERFGGGTPEENWEALNKALTGDWGVGVGIPEGRTDDVTDPERPSIFDLRMKEQEFEGQQRIFPPSAEFEPPFGPETGHRISSRTMLDRELGGGGGSLGAQIIFNNVPEGVETNAEGEGFDNFTVNKTRQLGAI